MDAGHWPLVGREDPVRTMTGAIAASPGHSLVITGPAGVGRTRLARQALSVAAERERPTLWAVATSAAALVPLGALAHLLPTVDVGSSGLALLQQAASAIAGDDSGPAPVLGVDDVHLLDQMSVTLLYQLAAAGTATLVLTVRSGTDRPDPTAPLWKDGLATRIQLGPLRRVETLRLLTRALGGDVDSRTCQRLWQLCRGNPLYLRELLEDGVQTGRLRSEGGLWRWNGPIRPSQRLSEIVLAQLGDLDAEEWRVLEAFATAEPLPLREVESLGSPEAVALLERRGIVTDDADGRPGFLRAAHPLYTEVVRSRAPRASLRTILRQLPVGRWDGGGDDLTAARCLALLDEDGPAPGPLQLTEAARRAVAVHSDDVAERLARAAVAAGGGAPAQLALLAATASSRPAEAEGLAVEMMREMASEDDRAEVTVVRALGLAGALARVGEARAVLSEQTEGMRSDRSRALLQATGAVLAYLDGEPRRAIDEARRVLSSEPCVGTVRGLAAAAGALGLAVEGSTGSALDMVQDGRQALETVDPGAAVAFARLALAHAEIMALRLGGRIHDLDTRAARLHQRNLLEPEWCGDAVAALHCGWSAFSAGRVRVAARWLREAHAGLRRADPVGVLPLCRSLLAMTEVLLGNPAAAQRLVAELEDRPSVPVLTPFVLLAGAVVAGADGRKDDAARLGRDAAERAASQGQLAVEALLLHITFRFGRPPHAVARLRDLTGRVDSAHVADLADHAAAVLAEDGEGLDRISRRLEDAGLLLTAADAAAEASAVHERGGARRAAATAMARAAALARECGLSNNRSLEMLAPPALTAREEEVARLASGGMSNGDIADRLVVSVRTVEAHLSHIYGKLGIASRGELAGVFGPAAGPAVARGGPRIRGRETHRRSYGLPLPR